jgi:Cu+-exporting ATPase
MDKNIFLFLSAMKKTKPSEACFHCGDAISSKPIIEADKHFCCTGCQAVFQLIHGAELSEFYENFEASGLRIKPKLNEKAQFDIYENDDVLQQILLFQSDDIHRVLLTIPEISCISCVWLLERLTEFSAGVANAEVNIERKHLMLDYNPKVTRLSEILKTLHQLGYNAHIRSEKKESPKKRQKEYTRLAVAGFAFGNVMLLSVPDYFNSDFQQSQFVFFFPLLSALFASVSLFYSAADYLKAALAQIKRKSVTMDLPITVSLLTLFFASLFELSSRHSIGYFDSLAGFIFFLRISKLFQLKAFDTLEFQKSLHDLLPLAIRKKVQDGFELTAISAIDVDDIIELRQGELLPCDSNLLSKQSSFDKSYITGESHSVSAHTGERLYAGSRLLSRSALLRVQKKSENSYLNTLWRHSKRSKSQEKRLTDRLATPFILGVFGVAFATFFAAEFAGYTDALPRAISVLIVACPCALAISAPFCFGSVSTLLARQGFFFSSTEDIERAANIKSLAFDKTGTLTSSEEKRIENKLYGSAYNALILAASTPSLHPLSLAISEHLKNEDILECDSWKEIPHCGIIATFGEDKLHLGSSKWFQSIGILALEKELPKNQHVCLAVNRSYYGHFEFISPLRKGLAPAWKKLEERFKTTILSGDSSSSASALAKKLGGAALFSDLSPAAKKEWIEKRVESEKPLMMLGDGMNDAAALSASDIGVSVIENHSFFSPSADAIIEGKKLRLLPQFFELIKFANYVFYICLFISLIYNFAGIAFAVGGKLTPFLSAILMPLSSVTILSLAAGLIYLKYISLKRSLT